MNEPSLKVALIQRSPVFLNLGASIDRAAVLIAECAGEGARLIVFPETWFPGYPVWLDFAPGAGLWDHPGAKALYRALAENSLKIAGPEIGRMRELARLHKAVLVFGVHERVGGTLYNTMVLTGPDGDWRIHRKLMPTYTERLVWGAGDGSTLDILETPFGKLGGLICWEHWMPLARAAMHARGETVHVAQWPMVKELHLLASRHYAFEGQCFVLASGCRLHRSEALEGYLSLETSCEEGASLLRDMPNELLLHGGSAVIAPDSSFVVEPSKSGCDTVYAELDFDRITEGGLVMDTNGHYARPDVFQLLVDQEPKTQVRFEPQKNR